MKHAHISFTRDASDGLMQVLEGMVGRSFEYKNLGTKLIVRLECAGPEGYVTLVDIKKKDAQPFTVNLYTMSGSLTYL